MRQVMLVMALVIGVAAAAGQAAAAPGAPPAKVCKNLLGKVVACPPPKPAMAAKPVMAPKPAPAPAKPGLMSHLAGLGHPTAPPPPQAVRPAVHAPPPAMASTGGSQTSRIGATAKCKDGTYWRSKSHSGACSRHNGVAVFY